MIDARLRGGMWERAALAWRRPRRAPAESVDVFGELRRARKILIVPSDRVGGLFIAAPTYKSLRQHYPDAEIHLLSDDRKAALARQIPFVDRVATGPLDCPAWGKVFTEVTSRLQSERFDLSFCLGPSCSFRLAEVCGACGARLRVGFARQTLSPFNVEIVSAHPDAYEGDQYQAMLGLLGVDSCGEVRWTISEDQAQQVRSRYLDGEFASGNVVGIDLAGGEGKGLSRRQLDDIVGRVVERGARAVLFFSLADRKQVNYLKKTYGGRVLAFEQGDLAGVAALLEGCQALVSCNTDLLHLAISLQIRAVGIFGEDPGRWVSPRNKQVELVQARDVRAVSISQVVRGMDRVLRPVAGSPRT